MSSSSIKRNPALKLQRPMPLPMKPLLPVPSLSIQGASPTISKELLVSYGPAPSSSLQQHGNLLVASANASNSSGSVEERAKKKSRKISLLSELMKDEAGKNNGATNSVPCTDEKEFAAPVPAPALLMDCQDDDVMMNLEQHLCGGDEDGNNGTSFAPLDLFALEDEAPIGVASVDAEAGSSNLFDYSNSGFGDFGVDDDKFMDFSDQNQNNHPREQLHDQGTISSESLARNPESMSSSSDRAFAMSDLTSSQLQMQLNMQLQMQSQRRAGGSRPSANPVQLQLSVHIDDQNQRARTPVASNFNRSGGIPPKASSLPTNYSSGVPYKKMPPPPSLLSSSASLPPSALTAEPRLMSSLQQHHHHRQHHQQAAGTISTEGANFNCPLHMAIQQMADISVIRNIVWKTGSRVLLQRDQEGMTPLALALQVRSRDAELALSLVRTQPDAARLGSHHNNDLPLHTACQQGAPLSVIQALLEAFPQAVFQSNHKGQSPIDIIVTQQAKDMQPHRIPILICLQRAFADHACSGSSPPTTSMSISNLNNSSGNQCHPYQTME